MRKDIIFPVLFFTLVLAPLSIAFAADIPPQLIDMLNRIVTLAYTIFGVFAVVSFMYAGIMFAVAKGDAQKLDQAKAGLIWAVVGAGLGIISASIMPILKTFLSPAEAGN